MRRWIHLGSFLVLAVLSGQAGDHPPSEIRKIEILPAQAEVRIEVTLSTAVTASVEAAQHPDRIVLKLPGTTAQSRQKRIAVDKLGVRTVRYGLNQPDPPTTHMVVDLDQEHSYRILTDGPKITLVIDAPLSYTAARRTPPAAAASRPLISSIGRAGDSNSGQPGTQSNESGALLTPPPSGPPIVFPKSTSDNSSESSGSVSSTKPSAKHPNAASLQQGTVFPSAGEPGSGVVPPVSGQPHPTGIDNNSQVSAKTQSQTGPASTALLQEPKLAANSSPNTAAPARQDTVASLPQTSGQEVAETARAKAPLVEQTTAATPEPATSANPNATAPSKAPATLESPQIPTKNEVAETSSNPAPSAREEKSVGAQQSAEVQTAASNTAPAAEESGEGSGNEQAMVQLSSSAASGDTRMAFHVKYVAQDAAYLDGGRAAGLTEGMKLTVRDLPKTGVSTMADPGTDVAELEVLSVAEASAVTEIHLPKRPVVVGDLAFLSSADQQALIEKTALSATRKYPAVVSFTENDTLDDEARLDVPKPPLPSINRARGRIGFDYIGTLNHDSSGMQSTNLGIVVQADITRLNGTYWNVSGYWRGRLSKSSGGQQTIQDLINRTYHLYTSYDNPNSAWVAGFGRMYLPWATSLDTIDGGYFGRKVAHGATVGTFLGSTPDPTSYSYAPNHEIGGAFVNFEGGSYDELHYTSTTGGGVKMQKWSVDRPFVFLENGIFFKRIFSIYQAAQLDSSPGYYYQTKDVPPVTQYQPGAPFGIGRSFLTLRVQPHARVEFSANHTYFRDLPTFDPNLVGTGLLDKFLMQGFSGGTRVEVLKQVWLSADLGLSNRSGDKKNSLNQMFGVTLGHLPWIGLHADARYSRFSSGFGSGSYEALSLSKSLGETLQLHILVGQQNFASTLSAATSSRFITGQVETSLGRNYFLQTGGTINRGNQMNYDQWLFTFGYRFDNRHGHRGQ